jgi:hypothetical protein
MCLASQSEVIVIDNGSVDGSEEALERLPELTLYAMTAMSVRSCGQSGIPTVERRVHPASQPDVVSHQARSALSQPTSSIIRPRPASDLCTNRRSPQPFHFRLPTFQMTLANGSAVVRKILPGSAQQLREYRMLRRGFLTTEAGTPSRRRAVSPGRSFLPNDHIFDERYPIFFNDVQLARSFASRGLMLWVTLL